MTNPMMRPLSRLFTALALVFAGAVSAPAQTGSPISGPTVIPKTVVNLSASQYGFVGDGSTNNDFATFFSNETGAVRQFFYLPCGSYKFSSPFQINGNQIGFGGDGENCVLLTYTGTPASNVCAITVSAATPTTTALNDVEIRGFKLTRTSNAATVGAGICWYNVSQTHNSDLNVSGFYQNYIVEGANVQRFSGVSCFGNSAYSYPAPAGSACMGIFPLPTGGSGYVSSATIYLDHVNFASGGADGNMDRGLWASQFDGIFMDSVYIGKFLHDVYIQPDDTLGFANRLTASNTRLDGGTKTLNCIIYTTGARAIVSVEGQNWSGGSCNNGDATNVGIEIDDRNFDGIFTNFQDITAPGGGLKATAWDSLTFNDNSVHNYTSGCAVTVPDESRYGVHGMTVQGNSFYNDAGGDCGVTFGTNTAGTVVLDIGPNNYTNLGTPETFGSGIIVHGGCGSISRNADMPCRGSQFNFEGVTSGETKLVPQATASGTLSLPAATDTLVGRATTDTLTNKIITTPTITYDTQSGLIALAGGGQAGATPLANEINRFTNVATDGNSALLPAATPGLKRVVSNTSALHYMNVFPSGTDTINAGSASASVRVPPLTFVTFISSQNTKWEANAPVAIACSANTFVTGIDANGVQTCAALPANSLTNDLSFIISGGGSAITTGVKGYLPIDFACTIGQSRLVADQSGSIVIDVWKAAGAVPTVADTITASALPTLSSAQLATDSTLTGWTTSVSAGDILGFNVNSATTVTQITLALKCTKS